jgi:hypothetical protein
MNRWPYIRDVALFVVGAAGVIHETVLRSVDRPTLLLLFGACLGLPTFLGRDEKKAKDE